MEPLNVKQEEGESRIDYSVRVYTELGLPVLHHPSGYLKYTIVAPGEYEHVVHNGGLYHRLKDQVDFYSLVVAPEGTRLPDVVCPCGNAKFFLHTGTYGKRGRLLYGKCSECSLEEAVVDY